MIGATARLLGCDVAQRAHDEAGPRESRVGGHDAGHAEVEDLGVAVPEQEDVAGLDVAMHDPVPMRVGEPVAELDHDPELLVQPEWPSLRDDLPELDAVQELHHDDAPTLGLGEVVHGDDVGMTQARPGLSLAEEPRPQLVRHVDVGGDHLEGDDAIQDRIVSLEDGAHAAPTDAGQDAVLADRLARRIGCHARLGFSPRSGPGWR
jgi:hypothetical protein